MFDQPRTTPAASGQQLVTLLLIGGLSVASFALFAFAFGHAEFQEPTGGDVWSRTAFLLAATGAIMTTILSCNFWQRRRTTENHAETISGIAANHALLEQVSAKQDLMSDRLVEIAEKIENQKWDIFGELAINAAAGADVIPFPRRTNGHPEGH